jgi:hypothetical protein
LDLEWQRFDLDLFEHAKDGLSREDLDQLQLEYPQLLPLYSLAVMRFGNPSDSLTLKTYQQFTSDVNILELADRVKEKYPEGSLKNDLLQLEKGLIRFRHFFPDRAVPKVKSMISAFTYSTVVDDSLLVIGLDNYMGSDFELYPEAAIPEYKFSHFSREYMVSDALKAWLITEFPAEAAQNLLSQMVYQGKILYLLSALLPEIEEYYLVDYQLNEWQWCEQNAEEIWSHFLEFELFFTTDNHKVRKYMGDAPFIPGFPEGSPGRVGEWLGFQIVKEYMSRNQKLSLSDLIEQKDANKILRESKYKPS